VSRVESPQIEPAGADALLAILRERVGAYVPSWQPGSGPGGALLVVYARMLAALAQRIDRAPDKNELAFLDLLGLELLAAQPARAPLLLTAAPALGDGRAPAGARFGAAPPGTASPIVFETEEAIALAAAQIAELRSVWPGRDGAADHSADALAGRPVTLWTGLVPLDHELYVAHRQCLALAASARVEVDVALGTPGSAALAIDWTFWDGELWRDVAPSDDGDDGTSGLTRSGTISISTACSQAQTTSVQGIESYWLRGRLHDPLPPGLMATLPEIDRLRLRTVLEVDVDSDTDGLLPDAAFAGAQALDPTKPFSPLGAAPGPDSVFYVACEAAFARPEAEVTLWLDRPQTAQEKADADADAYAISATAAMALVLEAATDVAKGAVQAGVAVLALSDPNDGPSQHVQAKVDAVRDAIDALVDMSGLDPLAHAAKDLADTINTVTAGAVLDQGQVVDVAATTAALAKARDSAGDAAKGMADLAGWVEALVAGSLIPDPTGVSQTIAIGIAAGTLIANPFVAGNGVESIAQSILDYAASDATKADLIQKAADLSSALISPPFTSIPGAAEATVASIKAAHVDVKWTPGSIFNAAKTDARIQASKAASVAGAGDDHEALEALAKLSPFDAALAAGVNPPKLDPPTLDWEYFDGAQWSPLVVTATPVDPNAPGVENLMTSGTLVFTAPSDWASSTVNGTPAHWLRARLDSGVYGRLRLVTWIDPQTKQITLMAVIEPRPPLLKALRIGYRWESTPSAPEHCLTHNDFQWADVTDAATWRGDTFAPFVPTTDETPTVYIGLDRPLPADRVGLYFGVEEVFGVADGPPVVWEAWDGSRWSALSVLDETAGLALPGIVHVLWPGGDEAVARFGTARTWLRARLRDDGDPNATVLDAVALNAVWAAQAQTITDELVGSSSGDPRQTHFLSRTPVMRDELIEVREVDGPRADVEWPLLSAELQAAGIDPADVRLVSDPVTGRVTEIWVPWSQRPSLVFSGPGDRHYAIERTRGRLLFGDGANGMIPPAGPNSLRARRYRAGGGAAGNVAAGTITQALSGVVVQSVTNPRDAEGGADGEPDLAVLERGPQTLRNYRQALSARDWEAMAREASPAVALARPLPATRPGALHAPGWVTVVIVPGSAEPRPLPSFELRQEVLEFLVARSPAAVDGRVAVIGPDYAPVGVQALVVPATAAEPGDVADAARAALAGFLHPLTGAPDGGGWGARTDVCLSDVAALLCALPGVDHIDALGLLDDGTPVGDVLTVPAGRIVCAGDVEVTLGGDG
jgi:Baseplate J-like protein